MALTTMAIYSGIINITSNKLMEEFAKNKQKKKFNNTLTQIL